MKALKSKVINHHLTINIKDCCDKYYDFMGVNYMRLGDTSTLKVFGYSAYARIGKTAIVTLFGLRIYTEIHGGKGILNEVIRWNEYTVCLFSWEFPRRG